MPIYTVGHSTHDFATFVAMLSEAEVTDLVDVRKLPGSKKFPHFNNDYLAVHLPEHGIGYRRVEALTGRRPVSTTVPFEVNGNWQNRSFHNYADHALGEEFQEALQQLIDDSRTHTTAFFCSEAVWWRCHRRIIADHLLARGEDVRHIMGPGNFTQATITKGGVVGDDLIVRYPQQEES